MKLPQMISYLRKFEGTTTMSFKINDSKLFKKFNQIWKKVEKLLKEILIVNPFIAIMINT